MSAIVKPEETPFKRRFNFKKANWKKFASDLDDQVAKITPIPGNYDEFNNIVKIVSRRNIPRGCRTQYVQGLTSDTIPLLNRYQKLYDEDPFSDETIEAGERLLSAISEERTAKWRNLLENMNMAQNSRPAWKLLKNLSQDPTERTNAFPDVTANQVASQLLKNGKVPGKKSRDKLEMREDENSQLSLPFDEDELRSAIQIMKTNKAPGVDDMRTEQIKQFGPKTIKWLLQMMNNCVQTMQIPKVWRQAKVVALLKPGKVPTDPKSYRPISLLCHLFKIFERMILNRISLGVDKKIIKEQSGFRPGRSCTSQILNLTQHIEDGYERKQVSGAVFVDLSAAYDTVNHRKLLRKLYNITGDCKLTQLIGVFLQNRRFFVTLNGKNSRWRLQKNGLAQGSVMAPTLYNIYTNDQPIPDKTRTFIYADDTAIVAQAETFAEVETTLTDALKTMTAYYKMNHLKPNPGKTQVCSFHLRNREADRKLNIEWCGETLEHCPTPKYLGVTLDRTLSFKTHCLNLKGKLSTRNNILRKLINQKWGAQPATLRTSALALCVSAAEYAAPVWEASAHAKHVNVAINESARIISGCLRPTPISKLYPLIGIAPPDIRREVARDVERKKQMEDPRHSLHDHQPITRRLKSRKSFLARSCHIQEPPERTRLAKWKQALHQQPEPREELSPGSNLPFPVWRTLNRLRVGVSKCKTNLEKWGLLPADSDNLCECGTLQDPAHLLVCPLLEKPCTELDLLHANDTAIQTALFWMDKI
ncbi:hypothetical protein M8J77_016091 [Diaphorina citri]|nr:hypothetical protein M8J77_016091 [Diaphorina citri]